MGRRLWAAGSVTVGAAVLLVSSLSVAQAVATTRSHDVVDAIEAAALEQIPALQEAVFTGGTADRAPRDTATVPLPLGEVRELLETYAPEPDPSRYVDWSFAVVGEPEILTPAGTSPMRIAYPVEFTVTQAFEDRLSPDRAPLTTSERPTIIATVEADGSVSDFSFECGILGICSAPHGSEDSGTAPIPDPTGVPNHWPGGVTYEPAADLPFATYTDVTTGL